MATVASIGEKTPVNTSVLWWRQGDSNLFDGHLAAYVPMKTSDDSSWAVRRFAQTIVLPGVVGGRRMTFGLAPYGNRMATEAEGAGALQRTSLSTRLHLPRKGAALATHNRKVIAIFRQILLALDQPAPQRCNLVISYSRQCATELYGPPPGENS